jgi:predicted enzyme related to lactoylglutathione lyase
MNIRSLRSVEIGLPDVAAAEKFFIETWHLDVAARTSEIVYLRGTGSDHHLLSISRSEVPMLLAITLKATSSKALDAIAELTIQHGGRILESKYAVNDPSGGEAITIQDPQGRVLRIVYGDVCHVASEADLPANADKPIRLAHAVLNSVDVVAAMPFYENVLGFKLSDRTKIMAFIRIPQGEKTNGFGDHHSIALADADNNCLNHIAFVMPTLESVMRGGGRMRDAGFEIEWGPGRHGPGDNAFNYFVGPAGFVIEYTAEVEQVDDSYVVRGPADWKWPVGRVDQWGISAPPSSKLKQAQREISFIKL